MSAAGQKYRTIVADPPWHYAGFGVGRVPAGVVNDGRKTPLPYRTMSVDEICDLPVRELAEDDAHLYLWTTNRYLPDAFRVVAEWGFRYSTPLIWCKAPIGSFLGGAFTPSAEFVLFCRRGKLAHQNRAAQQWFSWPRQGQGKHSQKPDAFLDLVERVSPGPYLEMFARRNRLGWDTFGNESLGHVELSA
jgi:N6-adenosine-specific RNA methylase IME4